MKALAVVPALLGAAGVALVAAASCGGGGADPFCGDGEQDEGEQCDDGNDDDTDNCRACVAWLPPRTTVKWEFNSEAAPGFTEDGCIDLGVTEVSVTLSGATELTDTRPCSERQVVFDEVPPGAYTLTVEPHGSGGAARVSAPIEQGVTIEAASSEHLVVVPPEAWIGPYTGTFAFQVVWGGADCAAAAPAINAQRVTLRVDGEVVARTTTAGTPLDGSATGPCMPSTGSAQSALDVPFGYGTIEIAGVNGQGEHFRGTFDTFVGAGPANPIYRFDVPTIYDAMPPDAEMPDAGVDAM